jgi:glucoside 3-dehydrogenase (cytochrome c) hitch-hiker subunit
MDRQGVDRREALRRLAVGGAVAATLPTWVETLSAFAVERAHLHAQRTARPAAAWKPAVLNAHQNATVIAITELIIPQTDTPGARAAKVNEFIDFTLKDASPDTRSKFLDGLASIDERARKDFSSTFVASTPQQQTALLTAISAPEAKNGPDRTGAEFFEAIKSLTIIGFYTSQVGMRDELGDDGTLVFSEFKGCTHPEHQ